MPATQAVADADTVLTAVRDLDPRLADGRLPVLLHGAEHACWPLVRHAGRLGLATRLGLQDTVSGPNGGPARDNAHLVELAAVWSAGRAGTE